MATIADRLWGARSDAKGRVISGQTAREVLFEDHVPPDFDFTTQPGIPLDYIHRRDGNADIYFVSNRSNAAVNATCAFRVSSRVPEIWDPVTSGRRPATTYEEKEGCTRLPIEFAPCGSWIFVFRQPAANHSPSGVPNSPDLERVQELKGPWTVKFDPRWGGPEVARFDTLQDWTENPDPGIKYFSGTATYTLTFDLDDEVSAQTLALDLGDVRELAAVTCNGKSLGTAWSYPFRFDLTGILKKRGNTLECKIVNFWPNRIIGDQSLPDSKRFTGTNIRNLTAQTRLMPSGLLGPVRILRTQ